MRAAPGESKQELMNDRNTDRSDRDAVRDAVQGFYEQHPYPPPPSDLENYRKRWEDDGRRRADFHLHFPETAYRGNLQVMVAGCGTSQAARHALRRPDSHVVGIDISAASISHTDALKRQHGLSNLELARLPVERVRELGRSFDLIVCTGVLHHLPDPAEGLSALREVLAPDGAIHLMVYGTYGRVGLAMLQEYCRRVGVGSSDLEIRDLANTLATLPRSHPLARLLGESPDFQHKDALADALLNPQECTYNVPQLFAFLEAEGLRFGRWVRQAPYLPGCGCLAATPHADRLAALPVREQYAALELFRGTMQRHSLIAYRYEAPGDGGFPRFEGEEWLRYVPLLLPEAVCLRQHLPAGAAAVLVNRGHEYHDLFLPIDSEQLRLYEAIDGKTAIIDLLERVTGKREKPGLRERARLFYRQLWFSDQVVFNASNEARGYQ
jgi:SAM-dependent methyltransferase